MKVPSPFFVIGTVGMVVTAVLHIWMALVLVGPSVHAPFFTLYPMFATFLFLGTLQLVKAGRSHSIRR